MTQITHIVLVGHTKEKLIEGIKQHPVHKVILILGKDPQLSGEKRAEETAVEIEKILKNFVEISKKYVDKEDIFSAAIELIKLINEEKKSGRKVKINVSGSMRTLGIACYITSLVTGVEIYGTLSEYDEKGRVIGVKKVYNIPPFPIKELPKERLDILEALYQKNGVDSIDKLITMLNPSLKKTSEEYPNERARISYHIKALKEDGFITTEKKGKNIKLKLSKIGEIYALSKEQN